MKRKLFIAFIPALLLELFFCGVALATHYEGTCGDNVTWSYDSHIDTLIIEGTGEMYDFYSISDIPWYGFRTQFGKVTIRNGVTGIGRNAFLDCIDVTSITIPSSVTRIGDMAFRGCSSLTSLTIPAQAASVGDYAFRGCSALTEIIFPQSVASIGAHAFYDCSALTGVTVLNPNAVIGDGSYDVFRDCSADLVLYGYANSSAQAYAAAAGLRFEVLMLSGSCGTSLTYTFDPYSGALSINGSGSMTYYYKDLQVPWFDYREKITSLRLPVGMTYIGHLAFNGCVGLTSVLIPDGVKSMGVWAFKDCSGLTSIVIPESMISINEYAFQGCDNLSQVYYSGTDLQWEAIDINNLNDGNASLLSAELVCHVPAPTFRLPASLTAIEADAFVGIKAKAVWIPSTVTAIDGNPFANSDVQYIYGDPDSIVDTFAWLHDYHFVPCTD